jgi:hypothetical protein
MLDQQKKELVAVTSDSIGKKEPVLQSAIFFPDRNVTLENAMNNENDDYWSLFLYAMKSPVTDTPPDSSLFRVHRFESLKY